MIWTREYLWLSCLVFIFCVQSLHSAPVKTPLANDPTDRGISNRLDRAMGWAGYDDPRESKIRAGIHAGYHEYQYRKTGNPREHERAKDQWGVVTGGARDNLQKYDAQH